MAISAYQTAAPAPAITEAVVTEAAVTEANFDEFLQTNISDLIDKLTAVKAEIEGEDSVAEMEAKMNELHLALTNKEDKIAMVKAGQQVLVAAANPADDDEIAANATLIFALEKSAKSLSDQMSNLSQQIQHRNGVGVSEQISYIEAKIEALKKVQRAGED